MYRAGGASAACLAEPQIVVFERMEHGVPYIGTWIETPDQAWTVVGKTVVPYIGTWIET